MIHTHKEPQRIELRAFLSCFKDSREFNAAGFWQLIEDTSEETAVMILTQLGESLGESARILQDAFEREDVEGLWKVCHKLAGSSQLVGFDAFAKTAKQLSHQLRGGGELSFFETELGELAATARDISEKITTRCFA